jgi:acyl transferase domain-containing protein/phosphopantetheinyl transferase
MSANTRNGSADIAIVGMACIFPKAPDVGTYWTNILDKVDAVGQPVPAWGAERYLDPDDHSGERIYTTAGGFLREDYAFDPFEFGIMPSSLDGGEPDHFLALKVARDALADAGIGPDHDHTNTGVILGHSTYLHRGNAAVVQHGVVLDQTVELVRQLVPDADEATLQRLRDALKAKLPPFNADIAPGLVPNVMTGRIANRLNLKGPNYLIDAACASSLLAVLAAAEELRRGSSDLMLAGGVNASMPAEVLMVFTQLGALSRTSTVRPFDQRANGTLLGEGLGVVVLKRLADAERDGDRIYAVVKGVGQSSDGKALGLLAPSLDGEVLAIERAYAQSGVDPAGVGLIEAHGTGIPLGDRTEIQALTRVFGERKGALPRVAIGSVKSMISHCIPAAGIAALIKTSLALHHKVLPPTLCDTPNPALGLAGTPFYVNNDLRPWIHAPDEPRRAAVNAFGFGGINTHAVLEEYRGAPPRDALRPHWAHELFALAAPTRAGLLAQIERFLDYARRAPRTRLRDLAATALAAGEGDVRLAIVADDTDDLVAKLAKAAERIADPSCERMQTRSGTFFAAEPMPGKLAFLFPGEGAQYPQMLGDLALLFPVVREWFDFWRGIFPETNGRISTSAVFAPPTGLDERTREGLERELHSLRVGSESMFMANQALYALLGFVGLRPDVMVGHSSGENSALVASGIVRMGSRDELREHIQRLNRIYEQMETAGDIARGALLTVGAVSREKVREVIERSGGALHLALDNCHHQAVLFGRRDAMERGADELRKAGGLCVYLPFDRAYHTPLFEPVANAVEHFLADVEFGPGSVPVYSCVDAAPFPEASDAIRHHTAVQWASCVRFTETVERMYDDGIRTFIEVGPSGNLTAFVDDILRSRPHVAVSANHRNRSGLWQLLQLLARVFVSGRTLELERLLDGRHARVLDLAQVPVEKPSRKRVLANTLPFARLSDAEAAELRAALGAPSAAAAAAANRPAAVAEATAAPEPAPSRHAAETVSALAANEQMLATIALEEFEQEAELPFVATLLEQTPDRARASFELDVRTQLFLRDHVLYARTVSELDPALTALPVVPLSVSMEMLIEAAALLADQPYVVALENVRAHNWVAVEDERRTIELRARRTPEAGRIHAAVCDGDTVLFEGEVLFAAAPLTTAEPLPALVAPQAPRWRDEELYTSGMFHGPLFHSIAHLVAWDHTGMDAQLADTPLAGFFDGADAPALFVNPVLLDAVGHVTAFWLAQSLGTDFSSFPSRIARIELVDPAREATGGCMLRGRMRFLEASGQSRFLEGDFDCVDASGRMLFRIRGWRDRFFDVPHSFYEARTAPRESFFGEDWSALFEDAGADTLVWYLPPFPPGFLEDAGAVWKRLLAHTVLSRAERAEWHALPPNPQRRSEWLLGRLALKEAVRYWLSQSADVLLYPADITIANDANGAPHVVADGLEQLGPLPEISLAHAGGAAVAVVAPAGQPVGVDLETLGRVRTADVATGGLTADERARLDARPAEAREELALRLWCAKEAAAKHLRSGLDGRPGAFAVRDLAHDDASATIEVDGTRVAVAIRRHERTIIALAAAGAPSAARQWN